MGHKTGVRRNSSELRQRHVMCACAVARSILISVGSSDWRMELVI